MVLPGSGKKQRPGERAIGGQDAMTKQVIIPLPDRDFDTTEVAIPWKHFVEAGMQVTFSTEAGQTGQTDPRLLTGVIFWAVGRKPRCDCCLSRTQKGRGI